MEVIYVVIGLIVLAIFIYFGYHLYQKAEYEYDYNIFNIWVIVRGFIGGGCLIFGIMAGPEDLNAYSLLAISAIMFLWIFINTWVRTNFWIALFSFGYQIIAVYVLKRLVDELINRLRGI